MRTKKNVKARKATPPLIGDCFDPVKVLHYTTWLRSAELNVMLVTLTAAEAGEECPLTLAPICDDALEWMPDVTYMKGEPTVRKMTLPCGHAFGAMSLLYYFARRKMQCPCCRAGLEDPLETASVPIHFRLPLASRVLDEQRKDVQEAIAADTEEARRVSDLLGVGDGDASSELLQLLRVRPVVMLNDVELSVFAHDEGTGEVGVQFQFRLYLSLDDMRAGGDAIFDMRLNDRRALSQHIAFLGLRSISLVVHARTMSGGVSELARCPPFASFTGEDLSAETAVPLTIMPPQIVLAGNTSFEILRDARTQHIFSLRWIAPMSSLRSMGPAVHITSIGDVVRAEDRRRL